MHAFRIRFARTWASIILLELYTLYQTNAAKHWLPHFCCWLSCLPQGRAHRSRACALAASLCVHLSCLSWMLEFVYYFQWIPHASHNVPIDFHSNKPFFIWMQHLIRIALYAFSQYKDSITKCARLGQTTLDDLSARVLLIFSGRGAFSSSQAYICILSNQGD